jgi:hypothetical protein
MTLAEFLLARIAEDEAGPRNWLEARRIPMEDRVIGGVGIPLQYGTGGVDTEWVVDPARVLADCEAKRRIVQEHPQTASIRHPVTDAKIYVCATCDSDVSPCPTLRLLALPYADHPDYQPEWWV